MKKCLRDINIFYLILLFLAIPLYFLLQGLYSKIILKSLNSNISLLKGIFYSIIEFYFSGITPSSTGGQPLQLYFMKKDKIPTNNSTITLILNTIFFKIIIVILGLWVIIFKTHYIFKYSIIYTILFILGISCDIFMVTLGLFLLFNKQTIKSTLSKLISLIKKIPFFGTKVSNWDVDEITKNYKRQTDYIKKHKKEAFIVFILTFIQRIVYFSIAFLVYKGLGFKNISYIELLAIQITVQITIELYPLPGGTILSETMFKDLFLGIFSIGLAEVGMIFTRLFAFYIPLIVSCIIIVTVTLVNRKNYINS